MNRHYYTELSGRQYWVIYHLNKKGGFLGYTVKHWNETLKSWVKKAEYDAMAHGLVSW